MKLIAYCYEPRSCAFVRSVPVEPFQSHDRLIYELPPFSTLVEPPERAAGKCAVWMDRTQVWREVSDHRGERGWFDYKGEEVQILRLGYPGHWGLSRRRVLA